MRRKKIETAAQRLIRARQTQDKIHFDTHRRAFVYRGRLVSGLLPKLQKLLYPTYSWELAWRLQSSKPSRATTTQRDQRCHGQSSGKMLDRQLSQAIAFLRTHELSSCVFVDAQQRKLACSKLSHPLAQRLVSIATRLTTPARYFFQMCHVHKLKPQYSQTTVGCTRTPIATMVDVTCLSEETGQVVLIENKVGYTGYLNAATSKMQFPFESKSDSAYNQHQLQLAMTRHLYNTTFASRPAEKAFVWRYDETGVSEYPLEAWAIEGASMVLNLLHNSH